MSQQDQDSCCYHLIEDIGRGEGSRRGGGGENTGERGVRDTSLPEEGGGHWTVNPWGVDSKLSLQIRGATK